MTIDPQYTVDSAGSSIWFRVTKNLQKILVWFLGRESTDHANATTLANFVIGSLGTGGGLYNVLDLLNYYQMSNNLFLSKYVVLIL